jgi:3-oxoadipate enol-lactonase
VREVAGPPGAPALVLVHGMGATGALNWFTTFADLGREFRVVALDQRGHGRGVRCGLRGFRLDDCADDVVATADGLGIDRFVPVGYSMGGPVAQLVWRRHRERVAGLVLCATATSFRGGRQPDLARLAEMSGLTAAAAALRLVPTAVRRQMVAASVARRVTDPQIQAWLTAELSHHQPGAVVEAARALRQFSSGRWIGTVDVPTAVVVTTLDGLVPPARQFRMAAAIPGAEVVTVAGDHVVCADDPGQFVPALLRACRSVAARALRTTSG